MRDCATRSILKTLCKYIGRKCECVFEKDFMTIWISREKPEFPFNDDHPVPHTLWNLEEFWMHGGKKEIPLRTVNVGPKFGLALRLSSFEKNYDYWCGLNFEGFRVSFLWKCTICTYIIVVFLHIKGFHAYAWRSSPID